MRHWAHASLMVLCLLLQAPANAASDEIEQAIQLIVTFCVAGGESVKLVVSGDVEGGFALKRLGVVGEGTLEFSSEESKGLVRGLQNEINQLAAEQQSEARRCMQPYIDRMVNLLIGAEEAELPVTQTVVRTQWFSSEQVTAAGSGLGVSPKIAVCVRAPEGWSLRPETAHFDDVQLSGFPIDYYIKLPSIGKPNNSSVVCGDLSVGSRSASAPTSDPPTVSAVLMVQGFRHEGLNFE